MDALIDRKESLKQELKTTQEDLETSKENHRFVDILVLGTGLVLLDALRR